MLVVVWFASFRIHVARVDRGLCEWRGGDGSGAARLGGFGRLGAHHSLRHTIHNISLYIYPHVRAKDLHIVLHDKKGEGGVAFFMLQKLF